jgi:XRE family transcriptional regulator, regulator of sulfur utilization
MVRGLRKQPGDELVARREANGWTRERLAELAGLAVNTVEMVERGDGNPGLETLQRLSRAMRLSVGELLTASERRQ